MSWVLLSVLWLIIQTQAIPIKSAHELEIQEIVHPKKLHPENNRTERYGEEERYAPEVQYQIILNGEKIVLHLYKAKHLQPDYPDTHYTPKGEETTRNPQNMKRCYYEGHILNEQDSIVSISTCDGLRGCFTHHDQRYLITPLQSTEEGEHTVLRCDQEEPDTAKHKCGERCVGRNQSHIRTSRSLRKQKKDFLRGKKYIDLFLVLDNAFYKTYKGNVTHMRSFVFEVLNLLNVIYNTIDIQVALVGMEIWSDGDKIKVEPSIGTTFNNFLTWHRSNFRENKIHDHAQLLSGIDFLGGRVGMAASNTLCSIYSVSVIGAKRKNNVSLVGVISHELGHVLGMPDVPYTTKCPSGSCVMNQYLSSKFPKDFSTISLSHFRKYLQSQKPNCILQAPNPKNIIKQQMNGNKRLEVGDDCVCSSPEVCTDLCCDPLTCQLKPGTDLRANASSHITD